MLDSDKPLKKPQSSTSNLPWVEKYRPRVLSDVVGNEDAINKLKAISTQGNLPNLIISGPPGTGKTTSIMCLAYELLGPNYKEAVLELNASDARGIDVVRGEIKNFAQTKVTLPPGRQKLVILDEADSMTKGAQQALRRTMEVYSSTTRFALACNISSKIIEPIQSRCAILRFTRLDDHQLLERIRYVLAQENIQNYTDDGLKALLFTAQGDLRQALNNLQSTISSTGEVTPESVYSVVDQPHPDFIHNILQQCAQRRLRQAIESLEVLQHQGYSSHDLIGTFFQVCKYANLPEHKRLEFIRAIGHVQLRLNDGCDSALQMHALLTRLCMVTDDPVGDSMRVISLPGK